MNNRRNERPACCAWFGNFSAEADFLNARSWCSLWAPVKLVNSYFRALGVVAFAGNPFTGILIFTAIVYGNPLNAIATVMTGVISILTCKLIRVPDKDVCSGVSVFNSILVGCILTEILPPIFNFRLSVSFWIILAIAGFLTNFVDQGLQAMMAPSRLPVQSVPFNIVSALVFLMFRARIEGFEMYDSHPSPSLELQPNETVIEPAVDWYLMLEGSVRAAGQIYGVGEMIPSIFIWIGFILFSPLLAFMFYVGSVTGAIIAVLLNVRPLTAVYSGLWSFNSLLGAGGVAFFVVQTPLGILLGVVNAILTVAAQAAITPLFMQTSIPVLSFPFNIAIMFSIAVSLRSNSALKFVSNTSFPEEHLLKHYGLCGSRDSEDSEDETDTPLRMFDHAKV